MGIVDLAFPFPTASLGLGISDSPDRSGEGMGFGRATVEMVQVPMLDEAVIDCSSNGSN